MYHGTLSGNTQYVLIPTIFLNTFIDNIIQKA